MSVTIQYQLEKKKVKVSPATTLRALLDEYCASRGFTASSFTLEHKGKKCDMSLPFRLCGINNNATLLVVPAVAVSADARLKVALQTPEGTRLMAQFPMSTSLYQVLLYWESQSQEHNFTKRLGVDPASSEKKKLLSRKDNRPVRYLQPVISTLNRKFDSFSLLRSSTFASLGVKSSCVCRLSFQFTDLEAVPAEAAHAGAVVEAVAVEKKATPPPAKKAAVTPAPEVAVPNPIIVEAVAPVVDQQAGAAAAAVVVSADGESCERNPVVYKPSDTQMRLDDVEVSDDFFQLSSADLRVLKAKMGLKEEQPLMTRAIREERSLAAFQFAKTKMRVRFPDRWEVEGTFLSSEGPIQLEAFVRSHLADPSIPFELYTAPPKQNLQKTCFLKQRLTPAAIIYCSWVDKELKAPFLSKNAKVKAVERAPATKAKAQPGKGKKEDEPSAKKKKGGIPSWFKKK